MRILYISGDYPPKPGGIAVYGRSLIRAVAALPEVEEAGVLAFGKWVDTQQNDGHITEYRHKRPGFLELGRIIRRRIRLFNPDLVHVLTLFPEGAWVSFCGRPCTVSLYGTEAGAGGSLLTRFLKARTLNKASLLLPISWATADKVHRDFKTRTSLRVINPGLSQGEPESGGEGEDHRKKKMGISPDSVVVMTLTRLVRRKGVDHLIKALTGLPGHIHLLIVGDGPDRARLEGLIQDLGLTGRVHLAGFVDRVDPWFEAADIFALASYEDKATGDVEGFGIVFLEAQARGLPVVGTDSGGIPEAFAPGRTGILVPPEDPQALAQAILKLADDPGLRERMGGRGKELVREKYDWADLAQEVVKGYQEVLGARRG